ncbi:MAG: HNH endonuclease [Bacteroidota bacterium]|jgi:hypothetical protein
MIEKKTRTKIPKESKVRAELQKEINSVCPFCDNSEVGHFVIHHIDENPANHSMSNLLLLCPICHSKITKGDIRQEDVYKKKIELLTQSTSRKGTAQRIVNVNEPVGNTIVGDRNQITVKHVSKVVRQKYPEGCIGYDTVKANYIAHLIKRYNEYKEYEVGKGNVNYAMFSSHLKKKFKIGPTRTIYNLPMNRFDELATYIQLRINDTKLGRVKGLGHKNYSTYDEFANDNG